METTERIVEAYVRYVKGWATIPNIRCSGQNEIDLLAIDPVSLARYHIEVSISISQGFRKLTAKPFDPELAKQRVHQAPQRRTVGFFAARKFDVPNVVARLRDFGFVPGNYTRVVVTWGWEDAALDAARAANIELWDFRDIVREIGDAIRGSREYFADDTLRTLNLFIHADAEAAADKTSEPRAKPLDTERPVADTGVGYWVYENWTNEHATVHRADCAFCKGGRGMNEGASSSHGQWLGPFMDADAAWAKAADTRRKERRYCGSCMSVHAREAAR